MSDRKLTDRVREIFDHHYVQVDAHLRQIQVYWLRDPNGREWVPFGGGPLYNESAKEQARWLKGHIEEFRSLLPKAVRDWPVLVGELDHRNTYRPATDTR